MTIHTIGDSHAHFGWSGVCCHWLGPMLCFSFGTKKGLCDIKKYNITNKDTVIFCFGEIDCRCHIYKHVTKTLSYKDIINEIVEKYFCAIVEIMNNSKAQIFIYNVVPPVEKCNTIQNPKYPYLGTDEERKKYVLYFNEQLKKKCLDYKYGFFNIYDKYTDEYGFLNKKLSDGNVHIKNGTFITEFIQNNIEQK